ncbi:hypothetical protein SUGI_0476600 [Cryptomeria japonica]|nr:hypothetical protein SUGI_0476600 [Cryptomeria japonica]
MSGRKALDTSAEEFLITDWAWKLVKAGKTSQVIDGKIREDGSQSTMERFVLVGILCSHVMVAFRPSIVEALKMLEGEAQIPEIPDRPLPLTGHGVFADEHGDGDSSVSDTLPSFSSFTIIR